MKYVLPTLIALLLTSGVAAQTPAPLAGFQVIAERQYAVETQSAIDTTVEGVFLTSARVYLFDTEDDAEPVWTTLTEAESITQDLGDDAADTLVRKEIDDMGDRAEALSVSVDLENDETAEFRTVVTQRGAMIVTVTVIANSQEAAAIADDIAGAMIARDPGTAPAVYDGYGNSSGGIWDVFLPVDAEELTGLTAYLDKETRPAS